MRHWPAQDPSARRVGIPSLSKLVFSRRFASKSDGIWGMWDIPGADYYQPPSQELGKEECIDVFLLL
jgi:hypothetical protein